MIQQFRKAHEDSHYAADTFWYQRELRSCDVFFFMDDKHHVKV